MIRTHFFCAVALICLTLSSCKKNAETETNDNTYLQGENIGDTLSSADEEQLQSYGMATPSDDQFIGLDGEPVGRIIEKNGIKGNIIKAMIHKAKELTRLKETLYYPYEGDDRPAQNGLVYSYGQRDLGKRLIPPAGNSLHRKYSVYGTDCSGLMINLLKDAGIDISNNTSVATFENNLLTALKNNSVYKRVNLYHMGTGIPLSQIRTGDFILWPGHIGFVCELKNGIKAMFQSNGTGFPKNEADQEKNLGNKRGVWMINLARAINGGGYWGRNYIILRFIEAGDSMEGGVVFYLNDDRKHGLVCAPIDQSSAVKWGPDVFVNGTVMNVGRGKDNTTKIVDALSSNSAAYLCSSLQLNGYSDWFMPSQEELEYMYRNLVSSRTLVNFKARYYWSSTEYSNAGGLTAYMRDMIDGRSLKDFHDKTYGVRAVRKF